MPGENEMGSLSVRDPGWVNMETTLEGPRLVMGSARPPVTRGSSPAHAGNLSLTSL